MAADTQHHCPQLKLEMLVLLKSLNLTLHQVCSNLVNSLVQQHSLGRMLLKQVKP